MKVGEFGSVVMAAFTLFTADLAFAGGAEDHLGATTLGGGGAFRGAAPGATAIELNPGVMAIDRRYVVEITGGDRLGQSEGGGRLMVVDGATRPNLAVGILLGTGWKPGVEVEAPWEVVDASVEEPLAGVREATLGFAVPLIKDQLGLGATAKYRAYPQEGLETSRAFTTDVGLFYRPVVKVGLGVVGNNLRQTADPELPRTLGVGVGVKVLPIWLLVGDGTFEWTDNGVVPELRAGSQIVIEEKVPLQVGVITRLPGDDAEWRLTAGLGLASDKVALMYAVEYTTTGEFASERERLYQLLSLSFAL